MQEEVTEKTIALCIKGGKNHRTDFESSPVKAALKDGEEETAGERRKKPM